MKPNNNEANWEPIAHYSKAIHLNPEDAGAYYLRGSLKSDLGDNRGAIADYNEAIRLNPSYADAYFDRGLTKSDLGDKQGKLSDLRQAAQIYLEQGNIEWHQNALKFIKVIEECEADYNEAIRLNPEDANAYYLRGSMKSDVGDNQGAIADYTKVIRLSPDHADAYLDRGLAKSDLGDKQGALADLMSAAQLYQDRGNAEWHQNALKFIKVIEKT